MHFFSLQILLFIASASMTSNSALSFSRGNEIKSTWKTHRHTHRRTEREKKPTSLLGMEQNVWMRRCLRYFALWRVCRQHFWLCLPQSFSLLCDFYCCSLVTHSTIHPSIIHPPVCLSVWWCYTIPTKTNIYLLFTCVTRCQFALLFIYISLSA